MGSTRKRRWLRSAGRVGCAALGVVLLGSMSAACGSDADDPSAGGADATSVTTTTSQPVPMTADEPEFTPVPLADIGLSIPSDCPTPWLPVYAQDEQTYPVSVPPTESRPSGGTPIPDLESLRLQTPDSDGDGAPDEQLDGVEDGRAYALRRGDGDLVLAVDGGVVGVAGGASWVGDLDGDGRDEILVWVAEGDGVEYPLFVVPGSTPAGRHDPRLVGAQLPASSGMPVAGTGDLDGDGAGDLLLPRADTELMVVSGTIIMDALGGAVFDDVVALVTLPRDVRSTLLLGEGRAVPIRLASVDGDPDATDLVYLTEPPIVLRTDREALAPDAAGAGRITGFENDDGRHVQLAMPGTRSGTQLVFVWNLDDPCAGPTPAA